MGKRIGIGLLGLGTVGAGVANIIQTPLGRNPLVEGIELVRVAVRDLNRSRAASIPSSLLTQNPLEVVDDPSVEVVVEVMGGIEPARSLIMRAIAAGKSVVTANKAVIARHGVEIAAAARASGVYVLIEAAVGGGIPIIEPLKQSLGGNRILKVSGIINGTTNYILSRIAKEGVAYSEVIKEAQELGYAESDPAADVEGFDAADKIAILSGLAFGGPIKRESIPTEGITNLNSLDVDYANKLGYEIKLLAVAERLAQGTDNSTSLPLAVWVRPTLVPKEHPLAGVNGVNNAILVEGDPIGNVMFYGPGAGAGPTASAVVADILNLAGIRVIKNSTNCLDPLLAGSSWRNCHVVDPSEIIQKHYLRLKTKDNPGVIGRIGSVFGNHDVSIQSIVQFAANEDEAEIVVITHEVKQSQITASLNAINTQEEIKGLTAQMVCI